jgi:hypothetical protein
MPLQDIYILISCILLLVLVVGVPFCCNKWEWGEKYQPPPRTNSDKRTPAPWAKELW